MLFVKTFIRVSDNSGAKYVRCLKVLKTLSAYGKKKYAIVGDLILVSVRFTFPGKKVKKGDMFQALVIRTKSFVHRNIGGISLMQNSVILLDKKIQPLGTRVFGPFAKEVKVKNYNKLPTIARFVI
jgi:large subunit ribosomal protein L14